MIFAGQAILRRLGIVVLCLAATGGNTAEIRSLDVTVEEGRYHVRSEARVEASKDDLYAVLIDYDLFQRFTSAIVASQNVEPGPDGLPRFHTLMEGCVLFWCRTFVRNGHLVLTPKHDIVAIANPAESDFEYSRERWRLFPEDEGTVMTYDFEMKPRFWVPPFIGPYLIRRALRKGGIRAIGRIEALARGENPET